MQANMSETSSGTSGYFDKFDGKGFHAWKLRMTFHLRRDELWDLVNGDEPMLRTLTIRVKGNLEGGDIRADSSINRNITFWKKKNQPTLSTIASYLADEPL
jgi:hypothetical protein